MNPIVTMLECASLLVLGHLGLFAVRDLTERREVLRNVLLGLLFSMIGFLVMNNPVEPLEGIRIDPRAAVIAVAMAFGGPVAGLMTTVTLATYRFQLGGSGALVGAVYVIAVGLSTLAFLSLWTRFAKRPIDMRYVFGQAALAGLAPAAVILALSVAPPHVYWTSISLTVPVNFLTVMTMGIFWLRTQDRRSVEAARKEAEARLAGIAASASVVLFQMRHFERQRPRFTFVSDAAEAVIGRPPKDLLAEDHLLGSAIDTEARAALEHCLQTAEQSMTPFAIDLLHRSRRGQARWLRLSAAPRSASGRDLVWDGTITDVTEMHHVDRLKDEFISVVSHELRTPMTSILGALGLIQSGVVGTLPEAASGLIETAARNGESLVAIIDDILDLECLRTGRIRYELTETRISDVIEEAASGVRYLDPARGIEIEVTPCEPGAAIRVDPARLNQVLGNLISNAIKFSPIGGVVTLSCAPVTGGWRICVRDRGAGVPEEFGDRIFGRFEQAECADTRAEGGAGLGLSIARALTEGMGGTIGYVSGPDGAMFHVTFPAVTVEGSFGSDDAPGSGREVGEAASVASSG